MSKSQIEKCWQEVSGLVERFKRRDTANDEFMLTMGLIQLIEREKYKVVNRYRANHGEPLLPTDPPKLPGNHDFDWIVDVPKEWISETGRHEHDHTPKPLNKKGKNV